jgi:replicative DNA helicase
MEITEVEKLVENLSHISHRCNIEAENSFLGGLILNPQKYFEIANIIENEKRFFSVKNQLIYKSIIDLLKEDEPITYITITEKLFKEISSGQIEIEYITQITDTAAMVNHLEHLANIIDENYKARKLNTIYEIAKNDIKKHIEAIDIWHKVSEESAKLFKIKESDYSVQDLMEALEKLDGIDSWGREWGIQGLDSFLGPLNKDAVVIIAGRPGHGKTSLILQIIDQWAKHGEKIFFQSMEMSRSELDMRRLSRFSMIPLWRIKRGPNYFINKQDENYRSIINNAASKIYDLEKNIFVSDSCGLTPEQIALNIKINHEKHGIGIFVLDTFHRVNFSGSREHRHAMENGLETIIEACKNNKITPIILAQLNRGIENHEVEREPRLSDLRECGRLEEAATNVLMIYWKYKRTQKESDKNIIKILSSKARDSVTGRILNKYIPEIYSFQEQINESEIVKG